MTLSIVNENREKSNTYFEHLSYELFSRLVNWNSWDLLN